MALAMLATACGGSDGGDDGQVDTAGSAAETEPTAVEQIPADLNQTEAEEDPAEEEPAEEMAEEEPAEEMAEEEPAEEMAEEEPAEEEPAGDGEPQFGGTLVVATQNASQHFNGNIASGTAPNNPGSQLFASLLDFDDEWNPQPYLANSWEFSDDALTLTLQLNEDATFHDGEPIESHDVAFSIDMNQTNHPFTTMFSAVASVDTPDPKTVVINLEHPHPAILIAMSPALLPIFPEHVYGDVENIRDCECNNQPGALVGSGPFVLEENDTTNGIIRMSANETFFQGRPYVDELVLVARPNENERLTELENGDAHIGNVQGVAGVERAQGSDSLSITSQGTEGIGAVVSMEFNLENEHLANKEVRQAVAYAIDKDFILNQLQGGIALRAKSPIHPASPYYDDSIEGYDFDPVKAGELLDAAGYPADGDGNRGITLRMDWIPTADDYQSAIAEYAKSALGDIGIEVELRASPDLGTWAVQRLAARDYDITMNILFMWADPIIGVHRSFIEANILEIPFANNSVYVNPELEEMMTAAGSEQDLDARIKRYAEIQAILAEDVPFHWIETLPTHSVWHTAVVNDPPLGIWGTMSPMHRVWLTQE